jgi:hypothetical protein
MIDDTGIENTYIAMCEMINYMVGRFDEAVAMAIKEENLSINEISLNVLGEKDVENIENYANLVTLCMAKGALDLYKYSPNTLLE